MKVFVKKYPICEKSLHRYLKFLKTKNNKRPAAVAAGLYYYLTILGLVPLIRSEQDKERAALAKGVYNDVND